jgi:hypothetical protein
MDCLAINLARCTLLHLHLHGQHDVTWSCQVWLQSIAQAVSFINCQLKCARTFSVLFVPLNSNKPWLLSTPTGRVKTRYSSCTSSQPHARTWRSYYTMHPQKGRCCLCFFQGRLQAELRGNCMLLSTGPYVLLASSNRVFSSARVGSGYFLAFPTGVALAFRVWFWK